MHPNKGKPINPERTAIVVVDSQEDYYNLTGPLAKSQDYSVMEKSIQPQVDLVRTASEAGTMVIFVRAVAKKDQSTNSPAKLRGRVRSEANYSFGTTQWCIEGSPGSEVFAPIKQAGPNAVEVFKNRNGGFVNTNLDLILRSNNIETIVLTGMATDGCVAATARDGDDYGYRTIIARDAVGSFKPQLHDYVLKIFEKRLEVMDSSAVISQIKKRRTATKAPQTALKTARAAR